MPHMDKQGPENQGSKTGRMLGSCIKNETESMKIGDMGIGRGLRKHSLDSTGKCKRSRYNETK